MSQFQLDLRPALMDGKHLVADLNAPQQAAVLATDGPVLILAGAGSGKTRALTRKIAYLVLACGYEPWEILAVTFTNKAAAEMRERAGHLLGARARDLWLGTFHSVGVRLLRRHGELVGVKPRFVIYDTSDQQVMIGRCFDKQNLDRKLYSTKAFAAYLDHQKRECRGPGHPELPADSPNERVFAQLYTLYEREMRAAGAVDFGDLIYLPWRIASEHPAVRLEWQSRFRYILVDEFQDTNRAQYQLLHAMLGPERRICVVGDDDQSIYGWRGAEVQNILGFAEDFAGATVIRLEQNYRSSKNILEVAGDVIAQNRTRHGKRLWTDQARGEPVKLYTAQSDRDEAEYVARRIDVLRGDHALREMAIFYRTNAQSRPFEDALRSRGIPYKVVGGLRFYDRAEIKDLVAYLKLIANPDDVVSLERVINRPARGIGKVTVERCAAYAADHDVTLWQAVRELAADGSATGGKLAPFVELMDELAAAAEGSSALAVIQAVLEGTRYVEALEREGTVEAEARIENVKELVGAVAEFTERASDRTLAAYLDEVSLIADLDQVEDDDDACVMMTAHTAKGLEFDVAFVTGLEEGLFPHYNSSESEEGIEEERRLAYVAMTRARHRLHLSYAMSRRRYGQVSAATASRFLDGLPQGAIEHETSSYRPPPPLGSGRWDARARVAPVDEDPALSYVYDVPDYADESQDPADGPGPGSAVFHPQFGEGRIIDIEGQGERAKARVRFADGDTRKLMARFLTLL